MISFTELGLSKPVTRAIEEMGYVTPTEIQLKTIPVAMAGKDLMASAQTGSGKTAAYALPIIECLQDPEVKPRALILAPTRELVLQVEEQVQIFGKYCELKVATVYGGVKYNPQIAALKRGVDIIVATPGRLLDHMERRTVDLSAIEILVLDEADRMLDMGFMPQVNKIVRGLSTERQTMMFSATFDQQVERIAARYLIEPVRINANTQRVDPIEIEQKIFHVDEFSKDDLLVRLIDEMSMTSVLVFTGTKRRATWVKDRLRERRVRAEEIHGDIAQSQREQILSQYRDGEFPVLVATDLAARGIDIPAISHVINYDIPESPDDYVHRIGRTGRAGRSGVAVSFVSGEQRHLVRDIERRIGRALDPTAAPVPKSSPSSRSLPSSARRFRPTRRSV